MDARLNVYASAPTAKFLKHLVSANQVLSASSVPAATRSLVKVRASQINGCGFCTDMHAKDAVADGESWERLNMVAAWREATVFNGAERAALALTEEGTRIADAAGGVSEQTWAEAVEHYDEEQLMALVAAIALINAFNRLSVIVRNPAGDYQPGQLDLASDPVVVSGRSVEGATP